MATESEKSELRTLLTRVRRIRRGLVRANLAVTLAQTLFWVALIAIAAAIVPWARRRHTHHALPGAGDDKPAGYELPAESPRRDALTIPDPLACQSEGPSLGKA